MSGLESKLLDAFSKIGQAPGSGLKSESISAPPDELVKAFEEELNNPSQNFGSMGEENQAFAQANEADPSSSVNFENALHVEGTNQVQNPNTVRNVDQTSRVSEVNTDLRVEASSRDMGVEKASQTRGTDSSGVDDKVKELSDLLEKVTQQGSSLSQHDLFRIQYLTGMLKVQITHGMKASQSSTQSLENLLKQQ